MNIYDISKLSGVSVTTVSRVLNGSDKVSEKTRQKVLSYIKQADYTPNPFARGLGLNTMRTVGILCLDPADANSCINLTPAIGFIERELRRNNFDSILFCVQYDMRDKAACLEMMMNRRVDAIIIVGSFFIESNPKNNQCILDAAKSVPIWLINGNLTGENVYCMLSDDYNITYTSTTELISTGVNDILFLYTTLSESEKRKMEGYKAAIQNAERKVSKDYIQCCPRDIHESHKFFDSLLADGLKFDGVVTCEDTIAVSVVNFALSKGISIPEELSVIGSGNSILSEYCYPSLTTVDGNYESLCVSAVSMLIRHFEGVTAPSKATISSRLILRNTTKKHL